MKQLNYHWKLSGVRNVFLMHFVILVLRNWGLFGWVWFVFWFCVGFFFNVRKVI